MRRGTGAEISLTGDEAVTGTAGEDLDLVGRATPCDRGGPTVGPGPEETPRWRRSAPSSALCPGASASKRPAIMAARQPLRSRSREQPWRWPTGGAAGRRGAQAEMRRQRGGRRGCALGKLGPREWVRHEQRRSVTAKRGARATSRTSRSLPPIPSRGRTQATESGRDAAPSLMGPLPPRVPTRVTRDRSGGAGAGRCTRKATYRSSDGRRG